MNKNDKVTWLFPIPGHRYIPTYSFKDTLYLSWESNVEDASMNLWCVNKRDGFYYPAFQAWPWTVNSTGWYIIEFHQVRPVYTKGCHLGFYNHTSFVSGDSIGDSPAFYLSFDRKANPKTWGKKIAMSLPATTSGSSHSSNGLSTGTEAGIGVGVAAAVVALIAIVVFFVIQNRRKNRSPYGSQQRESPEKPELPGGPRNGANPFVLEKPDDHTPEAPGDADFVINELDGYPCNNLVYEVASDNVRGLVSSQSPARELTSVSPQNAISPDHTLYEPVSGSPGAGTGGS